MANERIPEPPESSRSPREVLEALLDCDRTDRLAWAALRAVWTELESRAA
jgi:hypothetical protein